MFILFLFSLIGVGIGVGRYIMKYNAREKYGRNKDVILPPAPSLLGIVPFAVIGIVVGFCLSLLTIIPAGYVGVVDLFGSVNPSPVYSGLRLVNPFASVNKFSVKTMEAKEPMTTPSKEGMNVDLELSVWYSVIPERAPEIYKTIGKDYKEIILEPLIRSVIRTVTAEYDAKALYTEGREVVVAKMQLLAEPIALEKGIKIEKILLRSIQLPDVVSNSIELKLKSEQEAEQMKFILQKEQQEAERKRIEAQGIADFQKTVATGISEQLLKWKGIEATEKLANSPNTKVVVVGGRDGLPLILGSDK